MHGTLQYDGSIRNGVKQGCVLAPTLFDIFFSLLFSSAFGSPSEGVCLHSRTDGKLFNLVALHAKTKVQQVMIMDILFADDAALISHTEEGPQRLTDQLAPACTDHYDHKPSTDCL